MSCKIIVVLRDRRWLSSSHHLTHQYFLDDPQHCWWLSVPHEVNQDFLFNFKTMGILDFRKPFNSFGFLNGNQVLFLLWNNPYLCFSEEELVCPWMVLAIYDESSVGCLLPEPSCIHDIKNLFLNMSMLCSNLRMLADVNLWHLDTR